MSNSWNRSAKWWNENKRFLLKRLTELAGNDRKLRRKVRLNLSKGTRVTKDNADVLNELVFDLPDETYVKFLDDCRKAKYEKGKVRIRISQDTKDKIEKCIGTTEIKSVSEAINVLVSKIPQKELKAIFKNYKPSS